MPTWFWQIMLAVFAVHFLVFAVLALKRRRLASALAAGAFLLLFFSIAARLWLPDYRIFDIRLLWLLRIPAWILALAGITVGWRQRRSARAAISDSNSLS